MTAGRERDALITAHLGLVKSVARRMNRYPGYDPDEAVSDGNVGMVEAADRFDPGKGTDFRTFAAYRIAGEIRDGQRKGDTLTRDMRRNAKKLANARAELAQRLGRPADDGELAAAMGVTVPGLHRMLERLSGWMVAEYDEYGDGFLDRQPDPNAADPIDVIRNREVRDTLERAISTLTPRLQTVLSLYYGEGLNLREIGETLGLTESRVCQLHGEAIRQLRLVLEHDALA